ncbi:MAG: staphylolytic protease PREPROENZYME LASA [Rhodobacterales bacterium 32-66-7]|nr:MAG: staphylolytic protease PREPROENZYME LASA [Rhodobacterales bacterium 12-65-15]OYX27514.1 MAG: staphylolytic protease PREPROENZYME LASA [Rhodobacterales bacterium 32-66-7]
MEPKPNALVLYDDPALEITALAVRYRRANGPVMRLVNRLGGSFEAQFALVPEAWRQQIEAAVSNALYVAYDMAGRAPELGPRGQVAAVMASGAAGGVGGLATTLAELPVTVTVILSTIRAAASEAGLDPDEPWVRAECLRVFASGGPLSADDGIDTSFLTARMTLTGTALQSMIAKIAPKLAAVFGQKLAAQAVPVLGAVSGAALNAAFLSYFREMAHVRFALVRLAATHGAEPVLTAFREASEPARILRA